MLAAGILLPTLSASLHAAGVGDEGSDLARASLLGDLSIWLIALGSFLSVWVVSNTVDALRFPSPFAVIDATLTLARALLLAVVLAAVAIDSLLGFPLLTLLVCVPLVLGCGLVAGPWIRLNMRSSASSQP